ncbi:coadhesin-like [Mya arenaria]|uniref:coadhesin-like n=1 Tax=Mya arenaria TaxID=6604 RepID=UPI0022E7F69E|nr:coadhesin-like [Mya arenaria]
MRTHTISNGVFVLICWSVTRGYQDSMGSLDARRFIEGGYHWSPWSHFSACDCHRQLQQRERHCLSGAGSLAPGNCGHDAAVVFLPCDCNNQGGCHDNYTSCQTSYCSTYEAWSLTNCQATCGHCNPAGWGAWSAMSSCSVTCGTGTMTRHRNCLGTDVCAGSSQEEYKCNVGTCIDPVNGGWSPWSQFSQCSQSCGFGVRARSRHCDSPAPQGTGLFCIGESIQREACNTEVCPVDGFWTQWSPWTKCSLTCGLGSITRKRACTNPAPASGGRDCKGNSIDTRDCTDGPCAAWSHWYEGECSVTCGDGTRDRLRHCSTGRDVDCLGNAAQTVNCSSQLVCI